MADDHTDLLKAQLVAMTELVAHAKNMSSFLQTIKSEMASIITYMKDAETEVPEKMRRFIMYMHDVHDIMNMYTEVGQPVPPHILREAERCDDRYRHLLEDGQIDGGWLEKNRRDMSQRPGNRWDHSRLLPKAGDQNETGPK